MKRERIRKGNTMTHILTLLKCVCIVVVCIVACFILAVVAVAAGGAVKGSDRDVKRLLKNQRDRKVDATMQEIPDAAKVIGKLEKRVKKLEGELKMRERQYDLLWAWYKRCGGNDYDVS